MSPIIQPKTEPSTDQTPSADGEKARLRAELLKMILRREIERKGHAITPRLDHLKFPEPHIVITR